MHFLIGMLEKNNPDVINLSNDLPHLDVAARVRFLLFYFFFINFSCFVLYFMCL